MTAIAFPDDLKPAGWERKKDSFPAKSELPAKLKDLLKAYDAVDWKLFEEGWTKAAKTRAELDAAYAERERLFRSKAFALKKAAMEIDGLSRQQLKDKTATDTMQRAAKAIGLAAGKLADDIDAGTDALKAAYEKALGQLPDADEDDNEPPALLLDPRKLLGQLTLCKRDPARRVSFAYVDGKDKDPATLVMNPKTSGRALLIKLQAATGSKIGTQGLAWVVDTTLFLQPEKNLGGLTKKVRPALKTCGFRVAKVVVQSDSGEALESDEAPDEGDATAQPGGSTGEVSGESSGDASGKATETQTGTTAPSADEKARPAFEALLKAVEAKLAKTMEAVPDEAKKLQPVLALARQHGTEGRHVNGLAALKKLGELLVALAGSEEERFAQQREQSALRLRAAMRQVPSRASKLRPVMDLAELRASEGQWAKAAEVLKALDAKLDEAEAWREQQIALLEKKLAPLKQDPPDLELPVARSLQVLRDDIATALQDDVEWAATLVDMLAAEWDEARVEAQELKAALLASLQDALDLVLDPPEVALLAVHPLTAPRQALQQAIAKGLVDEARDALERLQQAALDAPGAIATEKQARLLDLQTQLEALVDPEGADVAETAALADLRTKAQALILEGELAPIPAALKALADDIERARAAIAERLAQALAALRDKFDRVLMPAGATDEDLKDALALRQRIEQALTDQQPVQGEALLRELVLGLRKLSRELARRLKQAQPDGEPDEAARLEAEAEQARIATLRSWIDQHLYTPNASIKDQIGVLLPLDAADDAYFGTEKLSAAELDQKILALTGTLKLSVDQTLARIPLVKQAQEALRKRTVTLDGRLTLCKGAQQMKAPTLPSGWGAADMKALAQDGAAAQDLLLKAAKTAVQQAQGLLSFDIAQDDGVANANAVLSATRITFETFDAWLKTLKWDDSPETKDELLACARLMVDQGLKLSIAQGRYKGAVTGKVPVKMLRAQLEKDWEDQLLIKAGDRNHCLGIGSNFPARPAYGVMPMHLSVYPNIYDGKSKWPRGTAQDPDNETVRAKLLTAMVGTERQGIHLTLEWTGEKDHPHNLKCFRKKKSVMWNAEDHRYGTYAAGKTGTAASADYTTTKAFGDAVFPSYADAKQHLSTALDNELKAMATRLEEMCKNRGLTDAEKKLNVGTELKAFAG